MSTLIAKRQQVGTLYTQQKSVKTEYDAAEKGMKDAQTRVDTLMKGFARGQPPPLEELKAATVALDEARKKFLGASQTYGQAVLTTHKAQEEVLQLAQVGKPMGYDGVEDAASLSAAEQTKLLGAPAAFDMGKLVEGDGKRVSVAIKAETKKGAQMLALQLEGAEPAYQKDLVTRATKNIKAMAAAANEDPAVASALMDAIGKTSGPAREQMLAIVAKALPSTQFQSQQWLETTQQGMLVGQLRQDVKQGKNLEVAADLITALKKAGRPNEAGDVVSITADGLKSLRTEFESRQAKVHDLDGHLGRLAGGFGEALGPERSKAAMDAFKAKHTGDYQKLDEAAEKYLKAKDVLTKLPRIDGDDRKVIEAARKMGISPDLNREQRLDHELTKFSDQNFEKLLDTGPGRKQLESALKDQLAGKKTWLDGMVEGANKSKDLKEFAAKKLPDLVAKGIGHMALATDSANLKQMLKTNAGLLGLDDIDGFMDVAKDLGKTKQSAKDVNGALEKLDSANYSPALKKLGGLLALPGALESLGNLGSASVPQKIKTLVDGIEVLSALSNSKVLEAVSKKLGPVGAAAAFGVGLGKLWDGKIAEGTSDVMAGVGTFMMTAGSISSRIPGGQLIGAALVVGSYIVGMFAESDSEKAEKAAQKDAKAYLMGGGLSEQAATALGNLKESDHRDVGGFINQVAPRFGMTSNELLEHLAKLPPGKLREFTEMVFKMRPKEDGTYAEQKPVGGPMVLDTDEIIHVGPGGVLSPQTMNTAEKWMRNNGIVPKDARPD